MTDKAKLNLKLCPVCGRPRGRGKYEFAHGKCAEIRAATDGKKLFKPNHPTLKNITIEQYEQTKRNNSTKRYLSGDLPKWMFS